MKKRFLSLALVLAMCAALLAGCGGSSGGSNNSAGTAASSGGSADTTSSTLDKSFPAEKMKIGVEVFDTTDLTVIGYSEYFKYLEKFFNVEFMISESVSSAEEELAFIESCHSAGCVGYIGGYNVGMATCVEKVTEYGMYYWGCERGLDEQFKDNPYYLGGFSAYATEGVDDSKGGDYAIGYALAKTLADQGASHVIYCSGGSSMGIPMFVDRLAGFKDGIAAVQAEGSTIQWDENADTIEGWPGTDDFAAAQSNAISKDIYDAVACSFSGFEIWAQPLTDAGKAENMKLAGVGSVSDSLLELFDTGMISLVIYEVPEIVFSQAFPMILNAATGHADVIKGDVGYMDCKIHRWMITTPEDYNAIYDFHEEQHGYYVTPDQIATLMVELNPDMTRNGILDFYGSLTMEACIK